MTSPIMVQVDLSRDNAGMTTWVDKTANLQRGYYVKLKDLDDNLWWKVEKVYDLEVPKDQLGVRGFDNNNYEKHDGTAIKDRK
jgi:hypothetical protein